MSGVLRRLVGPVLLVLGGVVFGLAVLSYPSMYIGRQQLTNKQAVHYLLKFYLKTHQIEPVRFWNNNHKNRLVLTFFKMFCFAVNVTGEKSFVNISILLKKRKIAEIWTKLFISRVTLKSEKNETTFWKCQGYGYSVNLNYRILLIKLGWKINVANFIKNKRRP